MARDDDEDEPRRVGGAKVTRLRPRDELAGGGRGFDGCAPNLCTSWKPFALFLAGAFAVFLFLFTGLGACGTLPSRALAAVPPDLVKVHYSPPARTRHTLAASATPEHS